jgi:hypothetical protein
MMPTYADFTKSHWSSHILLAEKDSKVASAVTKGSRKATHSHMKQVSESPYT